MHWSLGDWTSCQVCDKHTYMCGAVQQCRVGNIDRRRDVASTGTSSWLLNNTTPDGYAVFYQGSHGSARTGCSPRNLPAPLASTMVVATSGSAATTYGNAGKAQGLTTGGSIRSKPILYLVLRYHQPLG